MYRILKETLCLASSLLLPSTRPIKRICLCRGLPRFAIHRILAQSRRDFETLLSRFNGPSLLAVLWAIALGWQLWRLFTYKRLTSQCFPLKVWRFLINVTASFIASNKHIKLEVILNTYTRFNKAYWHGALNNCV